MAVLKRFSYDNIVEHNPTAPDPVEGGGGSGGGGGVIYGGKYNAIIPAETLISAGTFEYNFTVNELVPRFESDLPFIGRVYCINRLVVSDELVEHFCGFEIAINERTGGYVVVIKLANMASDITTSNDTILNFDVLFIVESGEGSGEGGGGI